MKSEFMLAINQLCAERRLSPDVVLEAVQAALISAYKRDHGQVGTVEVRVDPRTGEAKVFVVKDVVDTVQDDRIEMSLAQALRLDPSAQLGGTVHIENTPRDFGRIAAQTAKQVILQRIREAEREALFTSFVDRAGEIAHGIIQSYDYHSRDVIVNLDGAEALLPHREQVPTESYRRGGRLRAYVLDVRRGSRGPQITLSRRSPDFLRRLIELEVPEVSNGAVEIMNIAREAGSRSKVAVRATQTGVDPVGSCVGVRGQRIQSVVNELAGEKIDVVEWSSDLATYIGNALSPAKVMNVLLDDHPVAGKTATVIVPDKHLSLAIGKEGQNARLAAKLTGWRIDIKSLTEAAEETLGRLEDIEIPVEEMDLLQLAAKLMRDRDEQGGLTEEDRQRIHQELERSGEALVDWPDEEPQPPPVRVVQSEVPQPPVAEPPDAAGEPEPVEAQAPVPEEAAEAIPEPSDIEPVQAEPAGVVFVDEELEPTFEGEPVEESIGWVITDTQEDLYSGWDDWFEEKEEGDVDWESDLEEEIEEVQPDAGRGKKRKKPGRGRRPRGRGLPGEGDW